MTQDIEWVKVSPGQKINFNAKQLYHLEILKVNGQAQKIKYSFPRGMDVEISPLGRAHFTIRVLGQSGDMAEFFLPEHSSFKIQLN